jgi:hypothetical protein
MAAVVRQKFPRRAAGVILGLLVLASGACRAWVSGAPAGVSEPSLERRDIHSVPEFLAALPESLRSHYVLMFRSRSPQTATYAAPRVILYGSDARNVVAFDGSSETVDLMSFDEDEKSFVFREVTFPTNASAPPSMVVSEGNPERCRACHGTPPRPVWDTYPLWPGAYGEEAGSPPSDKEREGYASFLRSRADHPRYRSVVARQETSIEAAERRYRGGAALAANTEFTELLSELNAKHIAAELRASPQFEPYRYDLLATISSKCGDIVEWPRSWALGYAAFLAESDRANAEQQQFKARRMERRAEPAPSAGNEMMTRIRYLAETWLGVSTSSWTLALEKGTYDFTSAHPRATSFERGLFQEIAAPDQHAQQLYMYSGDASALCGYLGQRAWSSRRSAVDGSPPANAVEQPALGAGDIPALLERCAVCHERGVGPLIPFRRPHELASRLVMPAGSHGSLLDEILFRLQPEAGAGRMPLVFNPSQRDRANLVSYLAHLATEGRR